MRHSLILLISLVWGCTSTQDTIVTTRVFPKDQRPKNIVLMIGDGMGLSAASAAMYTQNKPIHLERFPVVGFHKAHSANNLKTDSAAGATAFACGNKTYNSAVGINTDSTACETILEQAEAQGLATGLVVTSVITHATPAAFYAHQLLRAFNDQIAEDLLKTEVDFIVGGGKRYFDYRDGDDRNLIKELKDKNYVVRTFLEQDLGQFTVDPTKNFAYFTSNEDPLPVMQGRTYLPFASRMATTFLNQHSDKGFFLMIEGSQIDWAAHSNQADYMLAELLDFDESIGEVLDFADENQETLVIVTGDHETGGVAINPGSKRKKLKIGFTSNDHTCTLVPVYAYGPGAEHFSGIYDNTAINRKMRALLQLDTSSVSQR